MAIFLAVLLSGCSNKELKVENKKILESANSSEKISDLEVEVVPVSDKKVDVITKIKPEVAILETEKVQEGEVPVVVVDPVEADVPVKEVNILPVVDDRVGIVTKVQPTIEVVEELPLEDNVSAIVIEPLVE